MLLLLSLLLRHTQFYQQAVHLEISLTLGAAYVSYVGAEALGLSGVLSLFFCGVLLGHYNCDVRCSLYIVHCTLHIEHCPLHIEHCTMHIENCRLSIDNLR